MENNFIKKIIHKMIENFKSQDKFLKELNKPSESFKLMAMRVNDNAEKLREFINKLLYR